MFHHAFFFSLHLDLKLSVHRGLLGSSVSSSWEAQSWWDDALAQHVTRLRICLVTLVLVCYEIQVTVNTKRTQNEIEEQRRRYFLCDDEICFLLHIGIISWLACCRCSSGSLFSSGPCAICETHIPQAKPWLWAVQPKKMFEKILRFFLKSMKLTHADGEPHAADVTNHSNTHGFFSPSNWACCNLDVDKSSHIFYMD